MNRSTPIRDELRDMIAAKIAAEHRRRAAEQIADWPEGHARAFADSVMELFPSVEKQGRLSWSVRWWPWSRKTAEPYAFTRWAAYTGEEPSGDPS